MDECVGRRISWAKFWRRKLAIEGGVGSVALLKETQSDLLCVCETNRLGGGVGLFLACEDLARMFDNSFAACCFYLFLFLKWRLACAH